MITHILPVEMKAALDALAVTNPDLSAINRYAGQTAAVRNTPALVVHAVTKRLYKGGKIGMLQFTVTIESSAAGDNVDAAHLARVALADSLFNGLKSDLIAAIAAGGKLTVDDWGQIADASTPPDATNDTTGDKLRSVLTFLAVCRLAS